MSKQTTRITTGNLYPQQEVLGEKSYKKSLNKFKENNMKDMDEKIKKIFKQVEDNQKCCD